jgi:hypothetical protein
MKLEVKKLLYDIQTSIDSIHEYLGEKRDFFDYKQNLKRNFIFLTYGFLSYQYIVEGSRSIFVYLAALLLELIALVILYAISNVYSKAKCVNVLIGAIPLLLFNYAIITLASLKFDKIPASFNVESKYNFLSPLIYYKTEILVLALGIIISYLSDVLRIRKLPITLKVVESKAIRQALHIWGLGAVSLVYLLLMPATIQHISIIVLPISRIAIEFVIDRRLTRKKPVF